MKKKMPMKKLQTGFLGMLDEQVMKNTKTVYINFLLIRFIRWLHAMLNAFADFIQQLLPINF